MQIIEKRVKDLIPYAKNPRKNDDAVQYVKNSILEFGFRIPIIIDASGVIVAGHTRLKAAKEIGMETVPCIVADDLTPEQIKAFRLADNKVAEKAEWDFDLLDDEISELSELFDFSDFGFDFVDADFEHEQNKEETRERVRNILNLETAQYAGVGPYDIPQINPVYDMPEIREWIGFNYCLSDDNPEGKGVHFFVDDYQFERVWNEPERYLSILLRYDAVLAPDFSPYGDMPMATQIYNHYRKHWCARYWQDHGVTVIPTIRASTDERSLDWYLDGEPQNGIVAISAMWTKSEEEQRYFIDREYKGMMDKLNPSKILIYGGHIDDQLYGNIEHINTFFEQRFRNGEEE